MPTLSPPALDVPPPFQAMPTEPILRQTPTPAPVVNRPETPSGAPPQDTPGAEVAGEPEEEFAAEALSLGVSLLVAVVLLIPSLLWYWNRRGTSTG